MGQIRQQQITKALDDLFQALEGVQTADRLFKQFLAENPKPQPPGTFESVEALADYLERKEMFDKGYAGQVNQTKNFNDRHQLADQKVKLLLPDNTRLIHHYQGERYCIWHRVPNSSWGESVEGEPTLMVKKADKDPTEEA